MIVGVYIPPTNKKEIYEETLEGILQAAAVAQGENAELIIFGDINVDLRGITNPRMELLQGDYEGQDERRAATISTLSSLGLEDTGKRFLQRKNVGIWTWSQVRQGTRVRSVCDYILKSPFVRVLTHRIQRVPGCSTDHRLVYADIPHGGIETQKKRKWGLQRWPVPKAPPSKLNRAFEAIRKAVPQEETKRSDHDDWISTQTWRSLHEKASLRWRKDDGANNSRSHYNMVKRRTLRLLQTDRNRRMEDTLSKAEALVESDPKRSFQLLASWYKRREGVNLL